MVTNCNSYSLSSSTLKLSSLGTGIFDATHCTRKIRWVFCISPAVPLSFFCISWADCHVSRTNFGQYAHYCLFLDVSTMFQHGIPFSWLRRCPNLSATKQQWSEPGALFVPCSPYHILLNHKIISGQSWCQYRWGCASGSLSRVSADKVRMFSVHSLHHSWHLVRRSFIVTCKADGKVCFKVTTQHCALISA